MSDPTPAAPASEWMCRRCFNLNGYGLTAVPWSCAHCGLPYGIGYLYNIPPAAPVVTVSYAAAFTQADVDTLDQAANELQGYTTEIAIRSLRDRIAALLPPRSADPLKSPPGY